jgi:hypothetical protein
MYVLETSDILEQALSTRHILIINQLQLQYLNLPVPMSIIIMCYIFLLRVMVKSMIHMVNIIMIIVDDVMHSISGNNHYIISLSEQYITLNFRC